MTRMKRKSAVGKWKTGCACGGKGEERDGEEVGVEEEVQQEEKGEQKEEKQDQNEQEVQY